MSKRTYQPNNRRRARRTGSVCACAPAPAAPSSPRAAARAASVSRSEARSPGAASGRAVLRRRSRLPYSCRLPDHRASRPAGGWRFAGRAPGDAERGRRDRPRVGFVVSKAVGSRRSATGSSGGSDTLSGRTGAPRRPAACSWSGPCPPAAGVLRRNWPTRPRTAGWTGRPARRAASMKYVLIWLLQRLPRSRSARSTARCAATTRRCSAYALEAVTRARGAARLLARGAPAGALPPVGRRRLRPRAAAPDVGPTERPTSPTDRSTRTPKEPAWTSCRRHRRRHPGAAVLRSSPACSRGSTRCSARCSATTPAPPGRCRSSG